MARRRKRRTLASAEHAKTAAKIRRVGDEVVLERIEDHRPEADDLIGVIFKGWRQQDPLKRLWPHYQRLQRVAKRVEQGAARHANRRPQSKAPARRNAALLVWIQQHDATILTLACPKVTKERITALQLARKSQSLPSVSDETLSRFIRREKNRLKVCQALSTDKHISRTE